MFDKNIIWRDTSAIVVNRNERQRREVITDDLKDSIEKKGIMNPLIVREEDSKIVLVAGERRLTCAIELSLSQVPTRLTTVLDKTELEIIELEENTKRRELSWQDTAVAYTRIHRLFLSQKSNQRYEDTADYLGVSISTILRNVKLGDAILSGDKSIAEEKEASKAITILDRRKARAMDAVLNEILHIPTAPVVPKKIEVISSENKEEARPEVVRLVEEPIAVSPREDRYKIVCADAIKFMNEFDDERFNLLHVDFPYGVDLNEQAQQNSFEGGGYDGGEEIYWELCNALAKNYRKLTGVSSHMLFWFSFSKDLYRRTLDFFAKNAPQIYFNPVPMFWHKTDNTGILPDAKRGPRNIMEPLFLATTGDRFIHKPVANVYGCGANKSNSIHTNEKPEAMLRHFMSMVTDEHSIVFDPTCGSGSAIRVAESLNAKSALGLEFNSEFAYRAQERLLSARNTKALSEKVHGK